MSFAPTTTPGDFVMPVALGISLAPLAAVSAPGASTTIDNRPPISLQSLAQGELDAATFDIKLKYFQLGGLSSFLGKALFGVVQQTPDGLGYYMHYQGGSIYRGPAGGAFSIHGSIRDKWASLGYERSFLGYPITDETGTPDQVGRYNHFEHGSIYWTPKTGAHEVHGSIRDKWASLGYERSFLGYPITDETGTPDQVGRYNHFENGSIYWTPTTAAHEVHGAIRDKWSQLGWERSYLGYPLTDEAGLPNGARINQFQGGNITWSPATGAVPAAASLRFQDTLTSDLPLGGSIDITLNSLGDMIFSGHLRDSGFDNIDYTLSAVVIGAPGTGIGFQRSGSTEGTIAALPFGTPNREDNFVKPDSNQGLADHWSQFANARLFWRLDATDTLGQELGRALTDLAEQGLKALGSAASQALVALVFA